MCIELPVAEMQISRSDLGGRATPGRRRRERKKAKQARWATLHGLTVSRLPIYNKRHNMLLLWN